MSDVPRGWTATTLGQLGRYINGRGFKKTEWSDQGRPIIRIQNLTGSTSVINRFSGKLDDRHVVQPGDLLVSWAATLGAYIWDGEEGALNQHIFKVESRIDRKFHKYLLDYKLAELMRHTHGSGMVHITRSRFDDLPVAIPGAEEQRRIVDILEDHLSRLHAADTYVQSAAARASVAAQSGALSAVRTAENESGTTASPLSALARIGSGTTPRRAHATYWHNGSIPWVTSGELAQGLIVASSEHVTEAALAETALKMWPAGTILVAMYGEGKTRGTVGELGIAATTNQACAAIALHQNDETARAWTRLVLRARYESMRRSSSGGVQPNLSLGFFKAMTVPWPDGRTMRRLIAAQAELTEELEQLRVASATAERRSVALRRSLLTAAFSGHLTDRFSDLDITQQPFA